MEQTPPSPSGGRNPNPSRTPSPETETSSDGSSIHDGIPTPEPQRRRATSRSVTPPTPPFLPRGPSPPPSPEGQIITDRPITPPSPDIPRHPGREPTTGHTITPPSPDMPRHPRREFTTGHLIVPPSPDQLPPIGPGEKGSPSETINRPTRVYGRKWEKEDYDSVLQKLDELDRRSRRPKPQKQRLFPHLPDSQIRHVKGLAQDDDFVVQILQFPPHEDGPQSNEFFDHLFQEAYAIVLSFVVNNYGGFDIIPDENEWKHPWNEINVSPLFISLAELVEDVEPDDPKGWDTLLYKQSKRNMMIVGMIARIFIDEVFSPILFGCTPTQATMLNSLETDMAEKISDGFARTRTRSRAVREVLDGEVLPVHFFDEVERLSLNIFGLLYPVSAYLEKYLMKHPDLEVTLPTRAEQFAKLFDMVSGTAWLSICARLHPEPIIIRMSEPGDMFNKDFDVVANYDEYFSNKGNVLKLKYDRLGEELEREEKLSQHGSTGVEELPATEILKERTAFVKTAIWPSIKIYSPVEAGEKHAQSGVTEYTIQRCEVAAQWVVPQYDREAVIPSLREWAKLA
ncbi:hypothetical protein V494_00191 [Pseudogymnoascus sp. VKM F-4513 (FW-928)]|nr:hypothetical protein V494_00191 [Pseudogymnoascus sp. VKM F-4513 (FW-928)]